MNSTWRSLGGYKSQSKPGIKWCTQTYEQKSKGGSTDLWLGLSLSNLDISGFGLCLNWGLYICWLHRDLHPPNTCEGVFLQIQSHIGMGQLWRYTKLWLSLRFPIEPEKGTWTLKIPLQAPKLRGELLSFCVV